METHSAGQNDICYFAMTNFRGKNRKFGIRTDDRRRHMYVIGKTGMGKSTMLENMIVQDIREGRGVGVVDPHGDLAEKIIDFIPSHRVNDIIYLNPADVDYPIAFNILESVDLRYKHLVASGLMGVFTKIWANVWSARMEYILSNCILALLDSPGNTLLGINRVLVDKSYRHKIVSRVTDPVVRSFWVNEFANYSDKFRTEAIAPIQNKVGQFLSTSIVRNIVGQTKSTIDLREIMDNKKILIMNLSKGRIGEDNSALLGAMMITKLQVAAMSRVDVPETARQDFFLYVDEFQNFATTSFKDILSEARKYRLSLIMAHQYIEQLDEEVAAAVFGNVGTIACFRVGATDAEELVKEFTPHFTEEDLVNLTKFEIYLRLMINGVASKPFSASSLAPLQENEKTGNKEKVIAVSHERYSRPRPEVEEKIIRWTGIEEMGAEVARDMNISGVSEEDARYREGYAPTAPEQPVEAVRSTPSHDNARTSLPAQISAMRAAPQNEPAVASAAYRPVVHEAAFSPSAPALPRRSVAERPSSSAKEATCDNCGKGTLVVFAPDEKRNVFCKKCLKLFKKGLIDVTKLQKRNIQENYDDLPPLAATAEGIQITSAEPSPPQSSSTHAYAAPAMVSPNFLPQGEAGRALPAGPQVRTAAHPHSPLVPKNETPAPRPVDNSRTPQHTHGTFQKPPLSARSEVPLPHRAAATAPRIMETPAPISLTEALHRTPVPFHTGHAAKKHLTPGKFAPMRGNSLKPGGKERPAFFSSLNKGHGQGRVTDTVSSHARALPAKIVTPAENAADVQGQGGLARVAAKDVHGVGVEGADIAVNEAVRPKKDLGFTPLPPLSRDKNADDRQLPQEERTDQEGGQKPSITGFIRGVPPGKVVSFHPQENN